jgi:DNA primase
MYQDKILEDILNRIDIVELISSYIPLKRAGKNFKALCPFHQEKTPSFMVSPQKQIYHCFGCGAGGNAFNFLMRYERIEFPEAVEILAKKAGIKLEERVFSKESKTLEYYKINEMALDFYQRMLNFSCGEKARDYLKKRNIQESTQKFFKLGFAPEQWDSLLVYLRQKNISLSILEKLGLVLPKENGGYYDRFRNRIIFPIFDIKSRVIGFGARIIEEQKDKDQAKYINSPSTPIYTKGEHLYGLNFAKDEVIKNDFVVVVEGYFDFILPFQEGLHNLVASLGTAFTLEQARLIKRYTHNIVIIYDGDSAGQIATLRSLDIFLEEDLEVKVVGLPSGFDPDLYVRTYGIESLSNLIKNAKDLFDYKLGILKTMYDILTPEGKLKISAQMLETINKINQPVLKATYIKKLAEELEVKEEAVWLQLKKIKDSAYDLKRVNFNGYNRIDIHPTEKLLIKLMLEEEEILKNLMQVISPRDFHNEKTHQIVSVLFDLVSKGKKVMINNLLNYFPESDILPILCELSFAPPIDESNKEKIIQDCVQRLKERSIRIQRENLSKQIKLAQSIGDTEKLNLLIQQFHQLTQPNKRKD